MQPEITKKQAKCLCNICLDYLKSKTNIDDVWDLASWNKKGPLNKLTDIYKKLLQSLSNRRGMKNSIGDIKRLSGILENFDPKKVRSNFKDWEQLFQKIKSEIKPNSRMEASVPQNYWVVFCKGAIDAATFLSKFKDGEEFNSQVAQFANSEPFIAALPEFLRMEITGLGFPLACDFLKESGWSQYAKSDIHTKNILSAIGFSDGKDYSTFKAIRQIAKHVNKTPYTIDKILWLIGSGNLYNKNKIIRTNRDEFLEYYKTRCPTVTQ